MRNPIAQYRLRGTPQRRVQFGICPRLCTRFRLQGPPFYSLWRPKVRRPRAAISLGRLRFLLQRRHFVQVARIACKTAGRRRQGPETRSGSDVAATQFWGPRGLWSPGLSCHREPGTASFSAFTRREPWNCFWVEEGSVATKNPVKAGSKFCRDCGGPVTTRGRFSWCENTTRAGSQQSPRDRCANLGREARLFCEQCGLPVEGIMPCARGHMALNP